MTLVVDASAAVEYLLKTTLGLHIAPMLEAEMLIAPELLDAEVLSVLRRETLAGRLDETRATEALDDLSIWDLQRLTHAPLLSAAWSLRQNVTAYDALYLAAAKLHDAAVLTVDGPLSRVPSVGVVIHNARE